MKQYFQNNISYLPLHIFFFWFNIDFKFTFVVKLLVLAS